MTDAIVCEEIFTIVARAAMMLLFVSLVFCSFAFMLIGVGAMADAARKRKKEAEDGDGDD